jgi:hypothetical protein
MDRVLDGNDCTNFRPRNLKRYAVFAASVAKLLHPASEARYGNTRLRGGEMETDELTKQKPECPPVMVLAQTWMRSVKERFGAGKHLTAKEFGQLKMLRRFLGEVTSQVIDRTLADWSHFALKARDEAGFGRRRAPGII